ncbi:MAG TPA: choice-of-anchor tandem repeat GloVer-containing protein [Rhodanobacteraceae bacterium]|nr:choice-of-anchor tandem repeat GloVer-containing protein [Rhodanobacteraceae bacterium]
MNGFWRYAFVCALTAMALLFAMGDVVAAPVNPQVLHAFCHPAEGCTAEQDTFGFGAQGIVAGSDGAYYGTTAYSNTIHDENGNIDAGGSVYRADPTTHKVSVLYQFPEGYYPTSWLKVGSDGNLYGGYRHAVNANADWLSDGFFRLSLDGEFKIIFDETKVEGFACNAPVQDSLGNWVGTTSNYYGLRQGLDFIYKITPGGEFKILHTLAARQAFDCPNYEPVLAADGNVYGIIMEHALGNTGAIYRLAPDETFTVLYTFNDKTDGLPMTPLTVGPDGALYGLARPDSVDWKHMTMYRISLDGQFINLGDLAPDAGRFFTDLKMTLMPDGYFYGPYPGNGIFRLSNAGELTILYSSSGSQFGPQGISPLIRGFDNALYGTSFYGAKLVGGALFRYVPPPVQ